MHETLKSENAEVCLAYSRFYTKYFLQDTLEGFCYCFMAERLFSKVRKCVKCTLRESLYTRELLKMEFQ